MPTAVLYDNAIDRHRTVTWIVGDFYDRDLDIWTVPPAAGHTYDNRFDVYTAEPASGDVYDTHHDRYIAVSNNPTKPYNKHLDSYEVDEVDDVPPPDTFVPLLFGGREILFAGKLIGHTP